MEQFVIPLARLRRLYHAQPRWQADPEMRRLFGRLAVQTMRANYWERRARLLEAELLKGRRLQLGWWLMGWIVLFICALVLLARLAGWLLRIR